jgi:RNA polymerase sigma-70 factor (ECF subfamily)
VGRPAKDEVSSHSSIADPCCFTRFAEQVGPVALRVAYRWTADRQQAEDVVQEALFRTWRSRERITENPRAWFFKILWRVFLHHQKRRSSHRETLLEHESLACGTDGSYDQVDTRLDVEGWLATLPEVDRHLLAMRYGEDFTIQEIADITGMRVGTVKSRIHRALKQLQRSLSVLDGTADGH